MKTDVYLSLFDFYVEKCYFLLSFRLSSQKLLLKTLDKNYIIDLGFRNMLPGYRDVDRGHILENVVFLELLRRNYRVYIGKVGKYEVDFVAEKPGDKLYIQVTESISVPETRERELRPLREIRDNYEKIILSMAAIASCPLSIFLLPAAPASRAGLLFWL